MKKKKKETKLPLVSVLIPFLNEPNIVRTYHKLTRELSSYHQPYELVFVSDGSDKKHVSLIRNAAVADRRVRIVAYTPNKGRGYAVMQGFKGASGEYIMYIDSDLDIHERHLKLVIENLSRYDIVIGSKVHKQSEVNTRFIRKIASPILNAIVRVGLGTGVHDHHVGLKGFRRDVAYSLMPFVTQKRWMFDAEIISLAQAYGYRIGEIPVTMTYGTGPIRMSYVRYFWDIILFIIEFRMRKLFPGTVRGYEQI